MGASQLRQYGRHLPLMRLALLTLLLLQPDQMGDRLQAGMVYPSHGSLGRRHALSFAAAQPGTHGQVLRLLDIHP